LRRPTARTRHGPTSPCITARRYIFARDPSCHSGEMKKGRHVLSAQKRSFCDCRHSASRQQAYSGSIRSAIWAATMRETGASVPNNAVAHEGATRIPPKESGEPDSSKGAPGHDRKNWLFWLAA
jgi:hypothetical protein